MARLTKPYNEVSSIRSSQSSDDGVPAAPLLRPLRAGLPATLQSNSFYPLTPATPKTPLLSPLFHQISDKYAIFSDAKSLRDLESMGDEADDWLHNPEPDSRRELDRNGTFCTRRGLVNIGCVLILCTGIILLFAAYPMIVYFRTNALSSFGAFNIGGINGSGQVPVRIANRSPVDPDTPLSAYQVKSLETGEPMELVFSDEFNLAGRSFFPGDDPYWEAVDMWYGVTQDLEWYDPRQVTTVDGGLRIWFNQTTDPSINHELNYMGGMISSWNKFCFTGGLILVSVSLPGVPTSSGLWPAVWTMGNLGRAGYAATLDGMWPYSSYDTCDQGTLANQTLPGTVAPLNGDPFNGGHLSFLPGQKLSRCTCTDDKSHPGPKHDDGSFVGRGAPEIDVFEAVVNVQKVGTISQSAQWAPFDPGYLWDNSTLNVGIDNPAVTHLNAFRGSVVQESSSALSITDQTAYTGLPGPDKFSLYGFEYKPGGDQSAYIRWVNNGRESWQVRGSGFGANEEAGIGERQISQEPMYILGNLGMSRSFGRIDPDLPLPAYMQIDWIRVYQPKGQTNIGCSPRDFPTAEYIEKFQDAYNNPNLTHWSDLGEQFPGNRLLGQCGA